MDPFGNQGRTRGIDRPRCQRRHRTRLSLTDSLEQRRLACVPRYYQRGAIGAESTRFTQTRTGERNLVTQVECAAAWPLRSMTCGTVDVQVRTRSLLE